MLLERSDGIHAFVGMLASVFASSSGLVFIDEPEAFLHPPLVRKLARQLATVARDSDRQFFIATHSPDLLASCAAIGADVNIIRLTHGQRSTARLLDSETLRELALDPLLRSEATLSALFHQGAVVCEAAADRVLYQEVNQRLLMDEVRPGEGLDSCVFLNAQNWQTVPRMIAPLRRMGVAAAAVIDADTLFEKHFTQILVAAQVNKGLRTSWLQLRGWLQGQIATRLGKPQDQVKLKGETIRGLVGDEQTTLASLLDNMARYGIFLVPVGELEDWFSYLGSKPSTDKSKWLRRTLDKLGVDPHSDDYARPTDEDIWDFMRQVNRWIGNPERLGTAPAAAPQGDSPS